MTLPALIQQLRAARPDSLTEIREAIAVVAEAVVSELEQPSAVARRRLREQLHDTMRDRDVFRDHANDMKRERDAAIADVQRLTAELAAVSEIAEDYRDRWATMQSTQVEQLEADRDRLAAEVKTIAETTERETVERIATFIDAESDRIVRRTWMADLGTVQLRVTAKAIREGKWKP